MKKTLAILSLALATMLSVTFASAQTAPAADDTLYKAFGEKAGITKLMDDFVDRAFVDPRIAKFFKDTKKANLKEQLTDQICVVTGGPCKYEGDTMKASHATLGIAKKDFNALVEVLQDAMSAQGVPFTAQNRLLALLAPMHRDIITVK